MVIIIDKKLLKSMDFSNLLRPNLIDPVANVYIHTGTIQNQKLKLYVY